MWIDPKHKSIVKRLQQGWNTIPIIFLQRAISRGLWGTQNMSNRSRASEAGNGWSARGTLGDSKGVPDLAWEDFFLSAIVLRIVALLTNFCTRDTSNSRSTLHTSIMISENASSAIVFCRDNRSSLVTLNSSRSFSTRAFSPDRPVMRSCKVLTSRASWSLRDWLLWSSPLNLSTSDWATTRESKSGRQWLRRKDVCES